LRVEGIGFRNLHGGGVHPAPLLVGVVLLEAVT
jgi:hypothetical protein